MDRNICIEIDRDICTKIGRDICTKISRDISVEVVGNNCVEIIGSSRVMSCITQVTSWCNLVLPNVTKLQYCGAVTVPHSFIQ